MNQADGGEFEDVFNVSGWHALALLVLVIYVVIVSTYREILDRLTTTDSFSEGSE